jgi:hypothetical protein
VYDSPWPAANRDLCVDVTVNIDPVRGIFTVSAVPLTGVIPEREDRVRIKDYRQTWTISSAGVNMALVVLEGYMDPAGIMPDWISNMLVIGSPVNTINGIKRRLGNR